jgi:hypothetical protein
LRSFKCVTLRWDRPLYLNRAWCLFELFTAVRNQLDVQIDMILPPSQKQAFVSMMATGDYRALENVLDNIHSVDATARHPGDLAAIQRSVLDLAGGFPALDETVRGQLRRWFEGQGAIMSSSRVQTTRRQSVLAGQAQRQQSSDDSGEYLHESNLDDAIMDMEDRFPPSVEVDSSKFFNLAFNPYEDESDTEELLGSNND